MISNMLWTKKFMVTLALLSSLSKGLNGEDSLVVQTTKGKVRGKTLDTPTGHQVDAWYSIPYAQPPLGDLRFRHPRPNDPWEGVKDTIHLPNSCMQTINTFFGDFEGAKMWEANTLLSEDCLYLNVIVPKPRPRDAAVMVWIHTGGFFYGTSTLDVYDYKTFAAEQQVIIVAPQYRVASLGFLNMGIADAPGNTGLFDQLMALQWVQDNINFFGGNRDNVTLFGCSGGSAGVSAHLFSPLSQNLFSQAIMQSGSMNSPWTLVSQEESIQRGLKLAESVGCPSNVGLAEVVNCLRKMNATELVYNEPFEGILGVPFVPVVDGAFFSESPSLAVAKENFKKANILLGSTTEEGYIFLIYFLTEIFTLEESTFVTRGQLEASVPEIFPKLNQIAWQAIIFEYTDWLNPDDPIKNRDALDKMVGDYLFTCGMTELAFHYAQAGQNAYYYEYKHRSSQHYWPKYMGVLHGDEVEFLFGHPLNPEKRYTEEEKQLAQKIMTYWGNFAKTGNPNLGTDGTWMNDYWPLHTPTKREYLTLATNTSAIGNGLRLKECTFWKNFLPRLLSLTKRNQCIGIDTDDGDKEEEEWNKENVLSCLQRSLLLLKKEFAPKPENTYYG